MEEWKMSEKLEFVLVPEKLPKAEKRKKGSRYDPIIDQFAKSENNSVRVDAKGVESKNLVIGLRNRLNTRGIKDIFVSQRGDKVYLVKK